MLKVLTPNKNKITGGYTPTHHGYDHSGKGDQNYYSSFYGTVVQCKNTEDRNWVANTPSDPWYVEGKTRALKTEDYGNYIKIQGLVDGKKYYQLGAHMKKGSVLPVGTEVKKGQVIAQIDNSGNSTASHSHTEYRDENNVNFEVEFVDEEEPPKPIMEDKRQPIIDIYKALTDEYPSEDEIAARLQQNKNRVELIQDILTGDARSKNFWMAKWGIKDNLNYQEAAERYKVSFEEIKDLLKLKESDNTEEVLGAITGLLERNRSLEKVAQPVVIYKYKDRDFEKAINIGNILIAVEKLKEG